MVSCASAPSASPFLLISSFTRDENIDSFLKEFEQELQSDGLDGDFMREFEREMNGGGGSMQDDEITGLYDDLVLLKIIVKLTQSVCDGCKQIVQIIFIPAHANISPF